MSCHGFTLSVISAICCAVIMSLTPRSDIFSNEFYTDLALSPCGKYVTFVAPDEKGVNNIFLHEVFVSANGKQNQITFEDIDITSYLWTGVPNTIIYTTSDGSGFGTVKKFDVSNLNKPVFTIRNSENGPEQLSVGWKANKFGNNMIIAIKDNAESPQGYYDYNILTNELKPLLIHHDFSDIVFDNNLNIRLASKEHHEIPALIYYRPINTSYPVNTSPENWQEYKRVLGGPSSADRGITKNYGFSVDNRQIYWVDSENSNLGELYAQNFDRPNLKQSIFSPRQAEITNVMLHPRDQTVIAVTETNSYPCMHILNKAIQQDIEYLQRIRSYSLQLNDFSNDFQTWLVSYSSNLPQQEFFVYSRPRRIERILATYPKLERRNFDRMIGFSFLARDGMRIQAYLHLNNDIPLKQPSEVPPFQRDLASLGLLPKTSQPMIVFIHGGPDERISYGYDPFGTWMSDRGYAGLFINFRGTAGFGKRYKDAGNGEWGRKMQTDIDDGVDFAINNGIADKNRIAVMGNSYGGFSSLLALELTPEKFVCGVDICGPTDLELQTKILLEMDPSFGMVLLGHYNVTDRDMEILKNISPIRMVSRIRAPLMVIHGGQDDHVPILESANLVDALVKLHKLVKFIEYPDEGHAISKPLNLMSMLDFSMIAWAGHSSLMLKANIIPLMSGYIDGMTTISDKNAFRHVNFPYAI